MNVHPLTLRLGKNDFLTEISSHKKFQREKNEEKKRFFRKSLKKTITP